MESREIAGVRPKPAFLPLIGFCGALGKKDDLFRMAGEPVSFAS